MSEIRTVEELAALPAGSVLRDGKAPGLGYAEEWLVVVQERRYPILPLTLLYRPDWPSQADLRAAVDAALALPRWDHLDAYEEVTGQCVDVDDLLRALAPVADPDPHTTSDQET